LFSDASSSWLFGRRDADGGTSRIYRHRVFLRRVLVSDDDGDGDGGGEYFDSYLQLFD